MIETVASVGLAIDERLTIFKNRIQPEKMTGNEKRICIVTGIHGDELEGQYVCYELNRILREQKERVKGIVDIYPAMNPLGVDSITRGVPGFDIDMNRIFPGSEEGAVTEHIATQIMEDISDPEDKCPHILPEASGFLFFHTRWNYTPPEYPDHSFGPYPVPL